MKMSTICGVAVIGIGVSLGALPAPQPNSAEILQQARSFPYRFRIGDVDAAPQAVALLEPATATDPGNAALWTALGDAYFLEISALSQSRQNYAEITALMHRALDAYNRALQIEPNQTSALGGHGMALTILSTVERKAEWTAQGTTELNRAVEANPALVEPRLRRAFTVVNLPVAVRNTATIVGDLNFLVGIAGDSRAGAMLHILLGDVHAETGEMGAARREYTTAAHSATAAAQGRSRLAALDHGGVPASDIARLRAALSSDCSMCHAR